MEVTAWRVAGANRHRRREDRRARSKGRQPRLLVHPASARKQYRFRRRHKWYGAEGHAHARPHADLRLRHCVSGFVPGRFRDANERHEGRALCRLLRQRLESGEWRIRLARSKVRKNETTKNTKKIWHIAC